MHNQFRRMTSTTWMFSPNLSSTFCTLLWTHCFQKFLLCKNFNWYVQTDAFKWGMSEKNNPLCLIPCLDCILNFVFIREELETEDLLQPEHNMNTKRTKQSKNKRVKGSRQVSPATSNHSKEKLNQVKAVNLIQNLLTDVALLRFRRAVMRF